MTAEELEVMFPQVMDGGLPLGIFADMCQEVDDRLEKESRTVRSFQTHPAKCFDEKCVRIHLVRLVMHRLDELKELDDNTAEVGRKMQAVGVEL